MAIAADMVRRVLDGSTSSAIGPDDGRRILEIACLAVAADGQIAREEIAVLHGIAAALRAYEPNEVDELVRRCHALRSRAEQVERLRTASDALTTDDARHVAYKVSVLTAMADLASTDAEFEFDLDLQDALRLPTDVADRLTGEVHEALTVE
jgi:hypothetical protein